VGHLSPRARQGDGDPLDICVLSERPISRSEVIVNAQVVGGLQVIDEEEADDKIIAVLENDNVWGKSDDLADVPQVLIERLRHYFTTYKLVPGERSRISIEKIYDRTHALTVVEAALKDYEDEYGQ
jgi:inorganic pyrophosphatase